MDSRVPELKRRGTAFHEAGHAVAALAFGWKFTEVTIVPVVAEGVPRSRRGGGPKTFCAAVHATAPTKSAVAPYLDQVCLVQNGGSRGYATMSRRPRKSGNS